MVGFRGAESYASLRPLILSQYFELLAQMTFRLEIVQVHSLLASLHCLNAITESPSLYLLATNK